MVRRGWVSAEVAPDVWKRLLVFDDGWVEVPGYARAFSDTRSQLRGMRNALVVLVVAGAATAVAGRLELPSGVMLVPAMVFLGALLWAVHVGQGQRTANRRQLQDDLRQADADRKAERDVRREEGAPFLLRRAASAQQLAGWLQGEVHVDGSDVLGVQAVVEGDLHVVHVRLSSGDVRRYASPDAALPQLLEPFAALR